MTRYFVFFYSANNNGILSIGNISVARETFPSRQDIVEIIVEETGSSDEVAITGWQEMCRADFMRFIGKNDKAIDLTSALDIRFDSDAGDNLTIRQYFYRLLDDLWSYKEGFSGKRPFGNSGWEYELYAPLIEHGYIEGKIDCEGGIDYVEDKKAASDFVRDLIKEALIGGGNNATTII